MLRGFGLAAKDVLKKGHLICQFNYVLDKQTTVSDKKRVIMLGYYSHDLGTKSIVIWLNPLLLSWQLYQTS